jgi:diguanylate cyclase (GGDEF)-like protein
MGAGRAFTGLWRESWGGWGAPFTAPVPDAVRGELLILQSDRLRATLPLICLTIAACAVAMTLAVQGDLPLWQQLAPPIIIIGACITVLIRSRIVPPPDSEDAILRELRTTLLLTTGLGFLAGLWCVNAFIETEKYYCMTAPVFIGLGALVNATCLLSVPRAAIGGIIATVTPIVIKMSLFDNLGIRAMAVIIVLVAVMQSGVVLAKFRETVAMLVLQHELNRLAESDPLTGLDNRLSFRRKLDARLATSAPVHIVLADLDGFKGVNDTHGHGAGDAVLVEVANRIRRVTISAMSVARLGGDEFALLYDGTTSQDQIAAEIEGVRATVPLPLSHGDALISVGISLGAARSPGDAIDSLLLLATADARLYEDKAGRKGLRAAAG